jgi:hypothetical protein
VLGVSDFTAGVIAALIGAVVGGAFAIVAGVVAARVEARRTEEIGLELRRCERHEEAMWELAHRLEDIRTASWRDGRASECASSSRTTGGGRTSLRPSGAARLLGATPRFGD